MKRFKDAFIRGMYRYVMPLLIWAIYRTLASTWRVTLFEPEALKSDLSNGQPVIFAHWHGDEIPMISLIGHYKIATITSTSVDGDLMTRIVHLAGGISVRGSSTRGGISALKGLLRVVKELKRNSSFAVDGPKGPIYKVKPGVFEVSRLMRAPIYSAGVSCDRAWVFPRSWNKTYLPKPFARIHFEWTGPLEPISREQDPHDHNLALKLEEALHYSRNIAQKKNFAQ